MATTLAGLRQEVFRRLAETQASPVFYTPAQVDKAINEGYQELSDFAEWYERRATFFSIARRTYYDLRTITPDTVLTVRGIFNPLTNQWLNPGSVRDLDRDVYPRWESNIGGAVRSQTYFMRGLFWLGIWPKNTSDHQPFALVYTAMPGVFVADSDAFQFQEEFDSALIEYALYDLFAQDRETKKALYHYQEYEKQAARFKVFVAQRALQDRVIRFRAR